MFLIILKVIHVTLTICAVSSALVTCTRMLGDRPFGRWALIFLQFSLAASTAGILLSFYHPDLIRWIAVVGVYVSSIAVLAWRRFHLRGAWADTFVLSTVAVLCLDALILIAHAVRFFRFVPAVSYPIAVVATGLCVVFLTFVVLSRFALRNMHHKMIDGLIHKPGR